MSDSKIVWSDKHGDLRKKKHKTNSSEPVDEKSLSLNLRRLTSGKGRTVIEITGLPSSKKWCQKLAKELKKVMGVGGAYKNDYIEVHSDQLERVGDYLSENRSLKWKRTGG
ncbi:MAG: hypothetical protein ACOCUH_01490 [Bacteriovoracia bacterium]